MAYEPNDEPPKPPAPPASSRIRSTMGKHTAVSYTHLDVYKRQCYDKAHYFAQKLSSIGLPRREKGPFFHEFATECPGCLLYTSRCV